MQVARIIKKQIPLPTSKALGAPQAWAAAPASTAPSPLVAWEKTVIKLDALPSS